MNYSYPRKKPSPAPKIIVTPEYLAKGSLKKSYTNTKLAFNVPWMGVVAMAFAKYPFFYNSLWNYMQPLTKSIEFDNLCKRLVIISRKKALELKPKPLIKNLKKIGFVDNGILINEYQERKDVEANLSIKIEAFKVRTDSLRSAFELEIKEAELKARQLSQTAIQKLSQELQQKEQLLSQRVQFEQQQIAQESQSLNDSIIKRVKAFVQSYGKSNSYNYILGSNEAGSVLYGHEASDLTQEILEALNESYSGKN